ncbi:LamG-like jellyroll fold domain-containing protein [Streptomyces sp. NPDC006393]|uniref:LamG-like jellyroll fold domain-containing protein n=1 Tax=Streptomyces sp. NPDC006393 TaxID=3156763 RepID=UPI00340AB476
MSGEKLQPRSGESPARAGLVPEAPLAGASGAAAVASASSARACALARTYPLTLDGNGLPPLLHAPVSTALTSAVTVSGGGTLCLDDAGAGTADSTKIQVHTCNGTPAQQWSYIADGSLRVLGKCLDVTGGGTADGTLLQLHSCNGTGAQKWTPGANGSLVNPQSGKCLDDPGASTTNGTQAQIHSCNNTAAQNWTSSAAAGWNAHPGTALTPVLPKAADPNVASPGDINSTDGGPDGNPDLYAVDSGGQLTEYSGVAPGGTTAAFAAPMPLGAAVNSSTHWWNLADGTGVTAADQAAGLDASLAGAYSWAADSTRGKVLSLGGTTGYAATTGPAVNTSQSFTVSAWVKLNSLAANSTFVSQSDAPSVGAANGFQLYYSSGAQVWAFNRHNADDGTDSFTAAYGAKAVTGKWTHLVGVFDADAGKLSLYVNGTLSATKDYAGTSWNATGPVQIGRRLYQNSYAEYANAQISDVRIWNTALPPADAAAPGDNPRVSGLS